MQRNAIIADDSLMRNVADTSALLALYLLMRWIAMAGQAFCRVTITQAVFAECTVVGKPGDDKLRNYLKSENLRQPDTNNTHEKKTLCKPI